MQQKRKLKLNTLADARALLFVRGPKIAKVMLLMYGMPEYRAVDTLIHWQQSNRNFLCK